MDIQSNETGDKSLRLLVDLLVEALNPLNLSASEKAFNLRVSMHSPY